MQTRLFCFVFGLPLAVSACQGLEPANELSATASRSSDLIGGSTQAGPTAVETQNIDGRGEIDCQCRLRYSDGPTLPVDDCDTNLCPSFDELRGCEATASGCELVASCTCECEHSYQGIRQTESEDTLLSGVVNLWQFEHGCGSRPPVTGPGTIVLNPPNAIGCGPIAGAEILYWWAQQGYAGLVAQHLGGTGAGPEDRAHDWQSLAAELYDEYFATICVPGGQTAVAPPSFTKGLRDYIADAGYSSSVGHYKVCDGCNVNGDDELTSAGGLELVKSELRAGRPVVMGFNAGRALAVQIHLVDVEAGAPESLLTYFGELSNGTPITGTISHYGVITGYRRFAGQDVVTVNLGWGEGASSTTDIPFLWNPAGKWLHLHTVEIYDDPDGQAWCALDRGLSNAYWDSTLLGLSHSGGSIEEVLAPSSCGIDRDRSFVVDSGTHQYETGYHCNHRTTIEPIDRANDPRITNLDGDGPVIFDWQEPLP